MDRFAILIPRAREQIVMFARAKSRWIWAALIATTGLAAAANNTSRDTDDPSVLESSVDTVIPVGHVLVPIEVVNYEALDSVLGPYGVVDLFAADPGNLRKSFQVASRIKILRAPRNPNHFAVLAPSEEAPELVRHEGGFFVVVQNPDGAGTSFEKPAARAAPKQRRAKRIRMEMEDE